MAETHRFKDEWILIRMSIEELRQLLVGSSLAAMIATVGSDLETIRQAISGELHTANMEWPNCSVIAAHALLIASLPGDVATKSELMTEVAGIIEYATSIQ